MRIGEPPPYLNYQINSFCTVTTKEVAKETLFLCILINLLYKKIPIVVVCGDKESAEFLESKSLPNVRIIRAPLIKPKSVVKRNEYHRTDAILLKFTALQYCIELYETSLFLDCDIIPFERFEGPSDCCVALSLNLPNSKDCAQSVANEGLFNAGMVYSSSITFVQWWRQQFLTNKHGGFYEQRCLNHVPGIFRTSYFDNDENFGFWRGVIKDKNIKSLHLHLQDSLDERMPHFMRSRIKRFRTEAIEHIKVKHKNIYEIYLTVFN